VEWGARPSLRPHIMLVDAAAGTRSTMPLNTPETAGVVDGSMSWHTSFVAPFPDDSTDAIFASRAGNVAWTSWLRPDDMAKPSTLGSPNVLGRRHHADNGAAGRGANGSCMVDSGVHGQP